MTLYSPELRLELSVTVGNDEEEIKNPRALDAIADAIGYDIESAFIVLYEEEYSLVVYLSIPPELKNLVEDARVYVMVSQDTMA